MNKKAFFNIYTLILGIIFIISLVLISFTAYNLSMPLIIVSSIMVSILAFAPILIIIKVIEHLKKKKES